MQYINKLARATISHSVSFRFSNKWAGLLSINAVLKVPYLVGLMALSFSLSSVNVWAAEVNTLEHPGAQQLRVFSQKSKVQLESVSANSPYTVIETGPRWSIVKFTQPTVPVWVSSDFVLNNGEEITTVANRLNIRSGPSLSSSILASVAKGYRSPLIGSSPGFTQIYAPTNLAFALLNQDIAKQQDLPISKSKQAVDNADEKQQTQWKIASDKVESPQIPAAEGESTGSVAGTDNQASADLSQSEQQSEPAADETVDPTPLARQHRLFPGDSISLVVFGEDELSMRNVRIPQSGQVSIPLLGSFEVAGKTTSEIEAELKTELSQGYVKNPRLMVTIDSYRPIFILGAASKIGSFKYSEGLTVAKAVAVAGGAKNSARENGISILRDGEIVEENLPLDSQMRVLSGDIITLEEEEGVSEKSSSYVYLHGEVRSPGEYEFRRGLTVEKAIVLAGGFTLRASRRKISVSRIVDGQEEPDKMKRVELHFPIQPGDIIDVGARWF